MAHKNRKKPPWGDDILGGEPVPFGAIWEDDPDDELRLRMERLRQHYGAADWYGLCVILGAQHDVALTIEKPPPEPGIWRNGRGREIAELAEEMRKLGWSWKRIADELRDEHRDEICQTLSADTLKARCSDVRRRLEQRRGSRPRRRTRRAK